MNHLRTILWQNRAQANCETCSLFQTDGGFQFQGVAVLEADGLPMHVRYRIDCTPGWKTREVELDAWRGDHAERFTLEAASDQRWRRDGVELAGFQGLVDTDLGFTPATNTLAIRRLDLAVGESGTTTTVWVDFPALVVRRFPQRYTRTGEEEYLFESLEDSFKARLRVDELGLVMDYEGLWIKAARTG